MLNILDLLAVVKIWLARALDGRLSVCVLHPRRWQWGTKDAVSAKEEGEKKKGLLEAHERKVATERSAEDLEFWG